MVPTPSPICRLHIRTAKTPGSNLWHPRLTRRSETECILRETNTKVKVHCLCPAIANGLSSPAAQPLEQLNPKKKVFETIQPGKSRCSCALIFTFSLYIRFHNIGQSGSGLGGSREQERTSDPNQGRRMCGTKFCGSFVIVVNCCRANK